MPQMHIPRVRTGFRVAAGVMDFIGSVVCGVLILCLLVLMVGLYNWLKQDLSTTFSGIGQNINEAVVIDSHSNR